MLGLVGEDLAINVFRLWKPASVVVLNG